MQKEAINTWSDGLVSDLNPINTPNTVLTDCVNGTFITYNGNEQSLQNDMGNYRLKNAELPKNYVPVGTAEYGDILYIVAYNPLTNKMQVGSFPSPQIITDFNSEEHDNDIVSILTQAANDSDRTYKHLIDSYQKMAVYYDAKGDLKIYPGDQYKLGDCESGHTYEKLRFYILDSDKNLHEITDEVIVDNDFHYVSWQVPGYLAAKWDLPVIDSVEIRPKTVSTKENTVSINANIQLKSSDNLVRTAYNNSALSIVAASGNTNIEAKPTEIDEYESECYYNAKEVKLENIPISTGSTKVPLNATPKISTEIEYDTYSKEIDLTDIFSEDTCSLGKSVFVYQVHNYTDENSTDKAKITFKFDLQNGVVSDTEIKLNVHYMTLSNYIGHSEIWTTIPDSVYDAPGTQIFTIDVNQPEQVYVFKFELTNTATTVNFFRIVLCSELINTYKESDYKDFDKIPMNDWLKLALTGDIKFGELTDPGSNKVEFSEGIPSDFWTGTSQDAFFKGKSYIDTVEEFKRGYTYTFSGVSCRSSFKYLYNFINATGSLAVKDIATIPIGESRTLNIPGKTYLDIKYKVNTLSDILSLNSIVFTDLTNFCPQGFIYDINLDAQNNNALQINLNAVTWNNSSYTTTNFYNTELIYNNDSNIVNWDNIKTQLTAKMKELTAGCVITCIHQGGSNLELFYSPDETGRGQGIEWGSYHQDYYIWGLTFLSNTGPTFIPFTQIRSTDRSSTESKYQKPYSDLDTRKYYQEKANTFISKIRLNLSASPKTVGCFINEKLESTDIIDVIKVILDCTTTITASYACNKNLFLAYTDSNSIYNLFDSTIPHEIFKLTSSIDKIEDNVVINKNTGFQKSFSTDSWPYKNKSGNTFNDLGSEGIDTLSYVKSNESVLCMTNSEDLQAQYNNLSDSNGKGFYVDNTGTQNKIYNILESYLNHTVTGHSFTTLRVKNSTELEDWYGCFRFGGNIHCVHKVFNSSNPDIIP